VLTVLTALPSRWCGEHDDERDRSGSTVGRRWHQAGPRWPGVSLGDEERARLGALVERVIHTKDWEPARGFELSQEIVASIAAHASLVILGSLSIA